MAAAGRVARVVLDSPLPQLDHLFDYSIPEELADQAVPGVRVRVPLRSAGRVADGYLVEVGDPDDGYEGTLSPIEAVVSAAQVLTPGVWRLARRLADRSAGTASDILRLAVPPRMVRVEKAWLAARAAAADAAAAAASTGDSLSHPSPSGDQMSPLDHRVDASPAAAGDSRRPIPARPPSPEPPSPGDQMSPPAPAGDQMSPPAPSGDHMSPPVPASDQMSPPDRRVDASPAGGDDSRRPIPSPPPAPEPPSSGESMSPHAPSGDQMSPTEERRDALAAAVGRRRALPAPVPAPEARSGGDLVSHPATTGDVGSQPVSSGDVRSQLARGTDATPQPDGAVSGESSSLPGVGGDQMSRLGEAAVPVRGYGARVLEDAVARDERIALRAIPRLVPLPDGTWVGEWAVTLATLAADCWRGGRTAIVAVPDHRDLEQLAATLAALAPADAVVRADAGQANADRYKGFLAALSGPRIVIGNRSVVYAPAERLGLLAVWEDSDPLHAEPLSPYVHTRDAALVRQELEGCALVLSGNIRSVEAQRLVELGWLRDIGPERVIFPKVVLTANQVAPEPMARAARIPSTAWRAAREALNGEGGRPRGPVLVQVGRPGYAPVIACAKCGHAARCTNCHGPLHQARAGAPPSCRVCGRLATEWQCDNCEHRRIRLVTVGSGRTAEELGRAFPGTRIILADGDHPVQRVSSAPALVVATRGAEPIAEGGYQAVLLLDGERMLARESLHVAEDCLRWWQSAAGLAAPGAPTVLVGVGGPLARDFATGRLVEFAHGELVDRRELRFPPAVRLASVTGAEATVDEVLTAVDPALLIDVLGPAPVDADAGPVRAARSGPEPVRAVLRFEYAHGGEVAAAVRAAVVKNATRRRRAPAGKAGYRPAPSLRVRFDDPEIL